MARSIPPKQHCFGEPVWSRTNPGPDARQTSNDSSSPYIGR